MSYVGGKARGSNHILAILNHPRFDNMDYIEPFVGYAHILHRVKNKRSYMASDANPLLIILLQAVQCGTPLPTITRERYTELKAAKDDISIERAVAAFQYSWNGKEWGGFVDTYTRLNGRVDDIPASRARHYAKLHTSSSFQNTSLTLCDYRIIVPKNSLIYCDPPYMNTTGYKQTGTFVHDIFWQTVREWVKDNIVFISEYTAPDDFVCISSSNKLSCLSGGHRQTTRTERLFVHNSQRPLISSILDSRSLDERSC